MAEPQKKRALVLSAFNDAGTGERFEAGDTPLIEAGAFANYEAAGLVDAAPPAAKSSAKPKAKRKVAAKAAAKPTPVPAAADTSVDAGAKATT